MIETIKRLPIIKHTLRLLGISYSTCGICGLPWNFCKNKDIEVNKYSGLFAQCSHCYEKSTAGEILDANLKVYEMWESRHYPCPFSKDELIDAVVQDLKKNKKI